MRIEGNRLVNMVLSFKKAARSVEITLCRCKSIKGQRPFIVFSKGVTEVHSYKSV